MMKIFRTEQENFWAGDFGNDYIKRNSDELWVKSNIVLFKEILSKTSGIRSILEYGANIGLNLKALKQILPDVYYSALEINGSAVRELRKIDGLTVYQQSILDFVCEEKRDFVFTKTLLIHIHPNYLPQVYDLLYRSSKKYICLVEYFNPFPVEVDYRGHKGYLFKRDFAGEMLNRFSNLKLIDYGFAYKQDPFYLNTQENITWFLLEKEITSEAELNRLKKDLS